MPVPETRPVEILAAQINDPLELYVRTEQGSSYRCEYPAASTGCTAANPLQIPQEEIAAPEQLRLYRGNCLPEALRSPQPPRAIVDSLEFCWSDPKYHDEFSYAHFVILDDGSIWLLRQHAGPALANVISSTPSAQLVIGGTCGGSVGLVVGLLVIVLRAQSRRRPGLGAA